MVPYFAIPMCWASFFLDLVGYRFQIWRADDLANLAPVAVKVRCF